ncbi:MAG: MarR family winged helix-turn-helix transcriptional regulator, partial [Solirubrobacteraceae bacterium]
RQLEEEGLVDRVEDAHDRRARLVVLSERGRERLAGTHTALTGVVGDAVDGWSTDEIRGLARGLSRLHAALAPADAPPLGPDAVRPHDQAPSAARSHDVAGSVATAAARPEEPA